MKQSSTIILFIVIGFQYLYAQKSVNGTLSDSKGNPISYAHVFLKNHQQIGTVSNEDGAFSIKIDQAYTSDTLVCSILGYETLYTLLESIEENADLVLEALPFKMEEVTVLSDNYLRFLLRSAIQNIPNNYPTNTHQIKAYNQDYTISNGVHSEIIEADLLIESEGYDTQSIDNKIYINQMRKTDDNRKLNTHLYKVFLFKSKIPYNKNPLIIRSFKRFRNFDEQSLTDFEREIDKADVSLFHQNISSGDTIFSIKVNLPSPIKLVSGETGKIYNPFFSIVSINKSDFAITEIQNGSIFSENKQWTIFKYRKVNKKYYPVFSKHIDSHYLPNSIKEYYNVKTLYMHTIIEHSENFIHPKRKTRLKKDTDIRSLKYKYDPTFWASYPHSLKVPSTQAVLQSISKTGDIQQQFIENQRRKKKITKH